MNYMNVTITKRKEKVMSAFSSHNDKRILSKYLTKYILSQLLSLRLNNIENGMSKVMMKTSIPTTMLDASLKPILSTARPPRLEPR